MEEITIIDYEETDLTNSMLIVAFPTVGLVSSIAGHFIIDSLKLNPIGTIISNKFMPATVIHKSIPSPPVRIYAGEERCGPDDACRKLAIIISEFMPGPEIIKPLVDKILNWTDQKGVDIILSLEGMHALGDPKGGQSKIYGIGSTPKMKTVLKNQSINQTQEGMITGVTGVLLYQGFLLKKDVICLLAQSHANYPDSRSAAQLLEKLDKMLPAIKIDPKPLYKEAQEIENKIRQAMEQAKPTAPSIPSAPYSMYG